MIDIKGLDKGAVLAALYNVAKPQRMGLLHYDPYPMTPEQAQAVISERGDDTNAMFGDEIRAGSGPDSLRFDYLNGRVMKVRLDGDTFNEALFDRDNGEGSAARAIDGIRTL